MRPSLFLLAVVVLFAVACSDEGPSITPEMLEAISEADPGLRSVEPENVDETPCSVKFANGAVIVPAEWVKGCTDEGGNAAGLEWDHFPCEAAEISLWNDFGWAGQDGVFVAHPEGTDPKPPTMGEMIGICIEGREE